MITQEELKRLLHYNPDTGNFTWLVKRGSHAAIRRAGYYHNKNKYKNSFGYRKIEIYDIQYFEHRLAWLYVYGLLPPDDMHIDHINGCHDDNRIVNLRVVTPFENTQFVAERNQTKKI